LAEPIDGDEPYEPDETKIIDNQDAEEAELPFYTITSYGADYPVDGLVKRITDGSIVVPPFQRGYVWGITQASRFIESLLLGLPIPGIFLSRERESQKLLVIDGQQRLRTLQYFYDGLFPALDRGFSLRRVHKAFLGASYKSLGDEDRRRLDDSIIHATIVHQETPSEDDSSIYQIFERLNTGGMRLSAQEIRTCIYHGPFAELLHTMNGFGPWREVFGPISSRMRDQEMILRFLALHFGGPYTEYMSEFINKFMGADRDLTKPTASEMTAAFEPCISILRGALGDSAFRPQGNFNAAVYDAVMVGIAARLGQGPLTDEAGIAERYSNLLRMEAFLIATETGTAHKESVESRLTLATAAFADLA
jgi:hypothetical protein